MSLRTIRETLPNALFTGSWRDALTFPLASPTWRVWVAGPDRVASFDCATVTVHAECTRHRAAGHAVQIPRRLVATDTHGRTRTVYLENVQPYLIVSDRGDRLPNTPDRDWLRAVEVWRLRRMLYPGDTVRQWDVNAYRQERA